MRNEPEVNQAVETARDVMEAVRTIGGLAMLDWHTEVACDRLDYQNFLSVLKDFLGWYLEDSDAWFATPWEVVQHWHRRSLRLAELSCLTK